MKNDTFPKLLLENARIRGKRTAIREKDYGIWQCWTWSDVADEVLLLTCGLAALGLQSEDRLAIIGNNKPEFYFSIVAAQALGAIPLLLYQDATSEEMFYVFDHAKARVAIVEDQEQVDKLLEINVPFRKGSFKKLGVFFKLRLLSKEDTVLLGLKVFQQRGSGDTRHGK